jgi:molybdenum cofactor cytidylyltransferase
VISAIVLAAGEGRRFGSTKPLALLAGKPLVRYVIDALIGGGVARVVVVVPPDNSAFDTALHGLEGRASCVPNMRTRDGMGTSLLVGLAALDSRTDAVLIALADEPTIQPDVVRALIDSWRAEGHAIVAPVYRGERGHPVLFDKSVFSELRTVSGDRGARDIIERDARRVSLVSVDADVPRDVDTRQDLIALERLARS